MHTPIYTDTQLNQTKQTLGLLFSGGLASFEKTRLKKKEKTLSGYRAVQTMEGNGIGVSMATAASCQEDCFENICQT